MTKAQQVRELIAAAKSQGRDAVSTIPAVMAMGFKRQLARAYVRNNWNKVSPAAQPARAVVEAANSKPSKQLSQSRDAVRKREARAAKKAAAAVLAA